MKTNTPQDLGKILTSSLGRKTEVSAIPKPTMRAGERAVVATFRTDEQVIAAIFVCDLATVIYAGCALILRPGGAAKEALAAGQLDPALVEDFSEILNIASGWVGANVGQRVRFADLYLTDAEQPPEVKALRRASTRATHMLCDIASYGAGRISLLQ